MSDVFAMLNLKDVTSLYVEVIIDCGEIMCDCRNSIIKHLKVVWVIRVSFSFSPKKKGKLQFEINFKGHLVLPSTNSTGLGVRLAVASYSLQIRRGVI